MKGLVWFWSKRYHLVWHVLVLIAGPKSILNKNNGILVKANDVSALAIELEKMISNPDKIKQLNKIAPESIDDFRANTVLKQWKHLIDWVINEEI